MLGSSGDHLDHPAASPLPSPRSGEGNHAVGTRGLAAGGDLFFGGFLILALALASGCEDTSYRDIGAEIRVLTTRTDALVAPAIGRLAGFRRHALPQIEIALHTASASGKVNLIRALEAIGDVEAVAILRHFAVYDPDPEVRTACDELLGRWAKSAPPLGPAAQAAQARIAEKRAAGEAPVVLGQPAN